MVLTSVQNPNLMGVEVPRLVSRLRETFSNIQRGFLRQNIKASSLNKDSLDSPPPAPERTPSQEKMLIRRTGWTLTWDVRQSKVTV